jgi:uncharacterized protein (TIGR03067 family)
MPWRITSLFAALLLVAADAPPSTTAQREAAVKKDKDQLQGSWSVTGIVNEGVQIEQELIRNAKLVFKGDRLASKGLRLGDKAEGGYKLDPTAKLKEIDIQIGDTATPAIYILDGDKLKICRTLRAPKRPGGFDAGKGSGLATITLVRDKS